MVEMPTKVPGGAMMNAGFQVGAAAHRFYGGEIETSPLRVDVEPKVKKGRRFEFGILSSIQPDRLNWFNIRIVAPLPSDGLFEFWTRHWNGDDPDPEFPFIYWRFQDVVWKQRKNWVFGRCRPTHYEDFDANDFTGFKYVKEIS